MIDRFMQHVLPEPNSGCWLWDGGAVTQGYGSFSVAGATKAAHRVSYELHCGPVPEGAMVLHSCDVRCCVNPAHLRVGTHGENMRDRNARGRASAGERNGRAKLTEAQARAIRTAPGTGREVAARFGVSRDTVVRVRTGKVWRTAQTPNNG